MELVDVLDSKSCVGNHVSVRPRPSANLLKDTSVSFFLCAKNYVELYLYGMKIYSYPITINNSLYNTAHSRNSVSFGTTYRNYINEKGEEFNTNSWLFRDDLDWKRLVKYENNHFKNLNRVNVVVLASSDGSEEYSKVMSLSENLPEQDAEKFFPIKGYDIDYEMTRASNSGLLNTSLHDRMLLQIYCDDYEKYFKETQEKLIIKGDTPLQKQKTLKATNFIKDKVRFERADMYNVLNNLDDNSNTILMCRNVLGYFEDDKIEKFIKIVSNKLKQESLFIIGEHDTKCSFISRYLNENGFAKVMEHVYKRI